MEHPRSRRHLPVSGVVPALESWGHPNLQITQVLHHGNCPLNFLTGSRARPVPLGLSLKRLARIHTYWELLLTTNLSDSYVCVSHQDVALELTWKHKNQSTSQLLVPLPPARAVNYTNLICFWQIHGGCFVSILVTSSKCYGLIFFSLINFRAFPRTH